MSSVRVVKASAGSGKTYQLTAEYIARAMSSPSAFKSILAVTFTNKATAEMKSRILEQLGELSQQNGCKFAETIQKITGYSFAEIQQRAETTLWAILGDYSSFAVSTIDKFFQRIVRSFFKELGLEINYELILDEKESTKEAIDSLINRAQKDSTLSKKLHRLISERIEDGKHINLHRELSELLGKAIGANFFAQNDVEIDEIEALFDSLTKEAKEAEKQIIEKCNEAVNLIEYCGVVELSDFKYKKTSFASYFYKVATTKTIHEYTQRFRTAASDQTESNYIDAKKCTNQTLKDNLPRLMSLTSEVMNLYDDTLELRSTVVAIAENFSQYILLKELGEELKRINSLKGQLSISSTATLINSVSEGASVPFIFEKLGSKYSTIFIDEFQDTSLSQWEGFLPLLQEAVASRESGVAVMLIGDVKQAIYRWRGGDWRLLASGIESSGELGDIEELLLDTSWRSEPKIIEFNNSVFRKLTGRGSGEICDFISKATGENVGDIIENAEGNKRDKTHFLDIGYNGLEQKIAPNKTDHTKGYVSVDYLDDTDERLELLAKTINDLKDRYKPSDIAVLVRYNSEGAMVAEYLTERGIEFMSDDALVLGKSQLVRFIVNSLRYSLTKDQIILRAMQIYLQRELSDEELESLQGVAVSGALDGIEQIVALFGLEGSDLYYLQSLCNIAYRYDSNGGIGILGFLEQWDISLSTTKVIVPENDKAVKIITIHKSKGLEFEAVVMPFVNWKIYPRVKGFTSGTTLWSEPKYDSRYAPLGVYPVEYAKKLNPTIFQEDYLMEGVSSIVDNVNLLYVALTRAKSEMYLTLNKESDKAVRISDLLRYVLEKEFGEKDFVYGNKILKERSETETAASDNQPLEISKLEIYPQPALKQEQSVD